MNVHRIVVTRHGGPDVLQGVQERMPTPGPGEVRVKVLAAGVSAYDTMLRRSGALLGARVPYTPGEDVVGVVDALGKGASGVELGQTVAGFTRGEGYAQYVCLPASDCIRVPPGVDPAQAVCLVANYLTAHLAMHGTAQVQRGERVLVHGAAGGVGTALLQLGKLAGLEMYGTASPYNHDLVSALGATPIDYRSEDFLERIRELTGDGVDAVFDPVGGARHLRRSYRALRKGGRLVWFGMAATKRKGLKVIPATLLMQGLLALRRDGRSAPLMPDLGTFTAANHAWYRDTLTEFLNLLSEGKIKPVVAERIPLLEAARAHERLERGGHAGKVVLMTSA